MDNFHRKVGHNNELIDVSERVNLRFYGGGLNDSFEVGEHILGDSFANSESNLIDKLTVKLCALLTLFTKFLSEQKKNF